MFRDLFMPTHLLLILVVVLLLFGPSKLPEIGRAFGKTIREFRRATVLPPEAEIADASESEAAKSTESRG